MLTEPICILNSVCQESRGFIICSSITMWKRVQSNTERPTETHRKGNRCHHNLIISCIIIAGHKKHPIKFCSQSNTVQQLSHSHTQADRWAQRDSHPVGWCSVKHYLQRGKETSKWSGRINSYKVRANLTQGCTFHSEHRATATRANEFVFHVMFNWMQHALKGLQCVCRLKLLPNFRFLDVTDATRAQLLMFYLYTLKYFSHSFKVRSHEFIYILIICSCQVIKHGCIIHTTNGGSAR